MKNNHNKKKLVGIIGFIAIIIAAVGIYFLFQEKETNISSGVDIQKSNSIICESTNPNFATIFNSSAKESNYTIKIISKDNTADKISFEFDGVYETSDQAYTGNSTMHADYNNYMADVELSPDSLTPVFSYDEIKSKVILSGEFGDLNNSTAKLFYLDSEEFQNLDNYSIEEISNLYQSKGFHCVINQ